MCSHLLVCADPAQQSCCLQAASTSHGTVDPCPMQCLLCIACPTCDVGLLHALLCVHGARMYAHCLAACLLLSIFADHPGGAARRHAVRVVRADLSLRPRRPSGHSREQEEAREGTAQEEAVAWAEQFPRGGGLSGACYVLYMCHPAMPPGRVSMLHSSLAPAWLLSRGSQELGRRPALLRQHGCVRSLFRLKICWRDYTLR